ncbi:hypothetical protein FB446DRAFT_115128 [Lentinula raphanica]|uniref:Uncharacterized protein n=1 Tax=Lentinula raphanica TaxID=153919 RepID=A0AA38UKZ6_9AGAR|nr:hypothetical protein FB446DRAFT_115128 [Lentinula raphanica]KAJ3844636.1 hypothetical protein F5878DRAFT_75111 [Lentinula raphanica]
MSSNQNEGNLNFAATRLGWTRNFTLTPENVASMSYATLESVLELNTLKIRALSLRVFVEHPPASGNFVKIRPWKDDGTLQSILMKAFFEDRMKNGITTNLDIRDGNLRENDMGDKNKDGGIGAKEWLKAHGLTKIRNPSGEGESDEHETETQVSTAATTTGGSGFFSSFGFGRNVAPTDAKSNEVPSEADSQSLDSQTKLTTEEDILRERGWGPPLMRRLTSRTVRARKSQVPIEEKDIQEEGDGEEIEIPEAEEANGGARPEKNALWRKHKPNSFLGSPKKSKRNGVEIIKTPADAMKPSSTETES